MAAIFSFENPMEWKAAMAPRWKSVRWECEEEEDSGVKK